ncbi:contactin-2-like [Siphateles boraxobius]|uniref:contactin-2-like n=1 Tax=Siphateles boraxobius TaxID=180520 RepID=UPI00406413AB
MDNESAVLGYKVLYKHEGLSVLKILEKSKTSITLPLPKDNGYVVLEIRSWGDGGDGAAYETIVSRDSGTGMMVQDSAGTSGPLCTSVLVVTALVLIGSSGL